MGFDGVIFDIDGVIVDSPHEQAWRETLQALMETEWRGLSPGTSYTPERFNSAVYQRVVAGKPREEGARAALEHFGVLDAERRAAQYAERKQQRLLRLIHAGDFVAFPDAVRFLLAVKARGLPVAAASSSRNASLLLGQLPAGRLDDTPPSSSATLLALFDADLSGVPVAHGKPAPDLFLAAAQQLGIRPERALVIEDAPSGIQAAKAAGMTALGVARRADQDLLAAAGADQVVTSLDDVDLDALARGRLTTRCAA